MSDQPTTESAAFLRDFLVSRIRDEHAATVNVLRALNPGDWRPDPKSKTAIELAWHLVHSERWFLDALANMKCEGGGDGPCPASMEAILNSYESGFEADLARLNALTGEQTLTVIDFYGMELPIYVLLNFLHIHTIHHRAQLATYIRPLGGKVPDIYGGSADTPYQP